MLRLVVVLPLHHLTVGAGFSLSQWPLHVTVAPTFVVDVDLSTVVAAIARPLEAQPALRVLAGADEGFGRAMTIPVSVVRPSVELTDLHLRLVAVLTAEGAVFDDPEFVGDGYRAHVTKTRIAQAHPGQALTLNQAAVVDMSPDGDGRLRRVVWATDLAT